jgi:hypothetical protein
VSASIATVVAVALVFGYAPKGDPTEYDTEARVAQERVTFLGSDLLQFAPNDDRDAFWEELGVCLGSGPNMRCGWDDCTPRQTQKQPCALGPRRLVRDMDEPDRSWTEMWGDKPDCPILLPPPAKQPDFENCVPWGLTGVEVITRPDWVVSDQPTGFGRDGVWFKLRLEVAEGEVPSPPSRVRARRSPHSAAATAWDPGRILGAIRLRSSSFVGQVEAHVRTFAAVPANLIQRVREGSR